MKKPALRPTKETPRTLSPAQLGAATGGGGVDMNPLYAPSAVQLNPLYVGNDSAADNPLYA